MQPKKIKIGTAGGDGRARGYICCQIGQDGLDRYFLADAGYVTMTKGAKDLDNEKRAART